MRLVLFVQAQKEDAARFEIALDIVGDIADVDIATRCYAAVDDVFLSMWGWHVFELGDFKSQGCLIGIKSSCLVKYSSPKTNNIELILYTFCMIIAKPRGMPFQQVPKSCQGFLNH